MVHIIRVDSLPQMSQINFDEKPLINMEKVPALLHLTWQGHSVYQKHESQRSHTFFFV